MRLLFLLAALLIPAQADAQSRLLRMGNPTPYVGPGDLAGISFTSWWGLRAYSAATAGTKAIRIKRNSDSAQSDINSLANGDLDNATASSFCAATSCVVVKAYDKVGSLDLDTIVSPPTLTFNCVGSLTCMATASSNVGITSTGTLLNTTTGSFTVVVNRSAGTNIGTMVATSNNNIRLAGQNSVNTVKLQGTATITATMSDAALHALIGIANGSSPNSIVRVDATETTGSMSASTSTSTVSAFGGSADGVTFFKYGEAGFVNTTVWNSTVRGLLQTNEKTYWGTP